MNKYSILCSLFCLLWLGGLFAGPAQALQIAVIESRALPAYEKVLKQVQAQFPQAVFSVYDLAGQRGQGEQVFPEIRKKNVDLILTFGTLATTVAKEQEFKLPIVFTFVLNPVASGLLANLGASGRNLTGVALDIPIAEQFTYFRQVVPQIRTIGVFYSPQESGLIIAEAQIVARRMGLNLYAIPITSPEEVPQKLNLLAGTDGLWMVADSLVFTPRNTEYILLYTLKEGLPFMGVSDQFVKAGALCSVSLDYDSIARQTIGQIAAVLSGSDPALLPVVFPKKMALTLNLKSAEIIGVRIPPGIIRTAGNIYQ